jgi:hypothetical protein
MNSATAFHPLCKGKGMGWGKYLLLVRHFHDMLFMSIGRGRERVGADYRTDILWSMNNLMPESTLINPSSKLTTV